MRRKPLLATVAGVPVLALGMAAATQCSPTLGRPVSDALASTLRGGQCDNNKRAITSCTNGVGSFQDNSCATSQNYYAIDDTGQVGYGYNSPVYCGNPDIGNACNPFPWQTLCGQ